MKWSEEGGGAVFVRASKVRPFFEKSPLKEGA